MLSPLSTGRFLFIRTIIYHIRIHLSLLPRVLSLWSVFHFLFHRKAPFMNVRPHSSLGWPPPLCSVLSVSSTAYSFFRMLQLTLKKRSLLPQKLYSRLLKLVLLRKLHLISPFYICRQPVLFFFVVVYDISVMK